MRIHAFEPTSVANGPGTRTVVWVQGCTLACPGCFNPESHSLLSGEDVSPVDLAARVMESAPQVSGLTISGGEPLEQLPEVTELCRLVRAGSDLSIIVFTGFVRREVEAMSGSAELIGACDAIVAGRFNRALPLQRGLRGSSNKELWLVTDRFDAEDFEAVPEAEVIITSDGQIVATGIDPVLLER